VEVENYLGVSDLIGIEQIDLRLDFHTPPLSGGIEGFFSTLVVNVMMRSIGFFMRTLLVLAGLLSWIGMLVLGFIAAFVWIMLPIIICAAFLFGLILLFK